MKISPTQLIGGSSILALLVLILYFYQTSPKVTDSTPAPVQVTVQESAATSTNTSSDSSPNTTSDTSASPPNTAEASLASDMGITLARVLPDGSAVIAGNAPEGSTVNIYSDGALIGTTLVTGSAGEWVIIPETALAPGAHLLTIEIIAPDGTLTIGTMALAVEIPLNGEDTPLVALVPYTQDSVSQAKILQTPADLAATSSSQTSQSASQSASNQHSIMSPRLTIRSIQALNPGMISVSGDAIGGTNIILSVNGKATDPVTPNDKAIYATLVPIDPAADRFALRGTLRNEKGETLATASITLTRGQVEQSTGSNALIVVQKGDALWRIAYKIYGQGIRYIDIYRQNQSSINNPDLIYPDQVFIVPNS